MKKGNILLHGIGKILFLYDWKCINNRGNDSDRKCYF